VSRRDIPAYRLGVVGQTVLEEPVFRVVSDQGQSSVSRSKGIVDDGLEDPPVDLSTDFELFLVFRKEWVTFGLPGSGIGRSGKGID